jgi:hypothetical protein
VQPVGLDGHRHVVGIEPHRHIEFEGRAALDAERRRRAEGNEPVAVSTDQPEARSIPSR